MYCYAIVGVGVGVGVGGGVVGVVGVCAVVFVGCQCVVRGSTGAYL